MGNSGKKRKRRRHLPKAGTATDLQQMHHQEHREIEHNIGLDTHDRTGAGRTLTYVLIGIAIAIVVVAALSLWLFT
jgi:CHASE3 domain sensor protein